VDQNAEQMASKTKSQDSSCGRSTPSKQTLVEQNFLIKKILWSTTRKIKE
jgi:hypothetical protein